MTEILLPDSVGRPIERIGGRAKVAGTAPYAYEQPVDAPLYLHPVRATIARGRVTSIDRSAATAVHDSVLVVAHDTAMRLAADEHPELRILQDGEVQYWGQFVAAVVAATPEIAREAAGLVVVGYEADEHDTELRADHPDRYAPERLNFFTETDTAHGDVDAALASAPVRLDRRYETPTEFQSSIEPGTTVAIWDTASGRDQVRLYDSNQGAPDHQRVLAPVFGLELDQLEVISPYVGGAFGAKIAPRPHQVLAMLAARAVAGRPVKFALARQHVFTGTTYRPPTLQRVQLGADADGRLTAIRHDTVTSTSRYLEYGERASAASRTMYAADDRAMTHRLVPLDVSDGRVMRGPGETPGMFALESAMDELAAELGLDPIELRIANEPSHDPETGQQFSSRELVWCLRVGAAHFGWADRDLAPRGRLEDGWWVGTGVAAAMYPHLAAPGSKAAIRALGGGRYRVEIGASDMGTGAWTVLSQVAADALGVTIDDVELEIGSSSLPYGVIAGGSRGTRGWSLPILEAAAEFRRKYGDHPEPGVELVSAAADDDLGAGYARYCFGAHFAEVRVHADTGEIRVPRLFGAFDVGRVLNPRTARSQFIGGITMGLSMALFEDGVIDHRFGHVITQDLASYHVATHADAQDIDAIWLGIPDLHGNVLGAKGVGEIGTVGVAAAIANAAWHATGVRVRSLPITCDCFLH